jgi:hypothetical protein
MPDRPDRALPDARAAWLLAIRAGTARSAGNDNGSDEHGRHQDRPAPSGTYNWRRGDGDDTIIGGTGDRLRLWNTLHTLPELLGAIRTDPGLKRPALTECRGIDIRGVTGRILLGRETVTFQGLDELVLGEVTAPD